MTRPTDLPELRQQMVDWLISPGGHHRFTLASSVGILGRPNPSKSEVEQLHEHETMRWRFAELFYVTTDMTELAKAAAQTMPSFSILREDMPSEFGTMFFESPIYE